MVRRYFFHLRSPDGIERDEIGLPFKDVEHAYLAACDSLPGIATEILRSRRNPMEFSFVLENAKGHVLMTVPFTELLRGQNQRSTSEQEVGS